MQHIAVDSPIKVPQLQSGKPEITLAPLIDVVFLLLIFFMVTTVFPDNQGLMIEKPESSQSQPLSKVSLTFSMDKAGVVFFKDKKVELADVARLVKEEAGGSSGASVILLADKAAATQYLIAVMDAVQQGGVTRIGIATKPDDVQ